MILVRQDFNHPPCHCGQTKLVCKASKPCDHARCYNHITGRHPISTNPKASFSSMKTIPSFTTNYMRTKNSNYKSPACTLSTSDSDHKSCTQSANHARSAFISGHSSEPPVHAQASLRLHTPSCTQWKPGSLWCIP
eukprot:223289-Hanusia_phi.AAC.2